MVGLGCMRLSTEPDRDEERAVATLHAALDAGVRLLDTADAYCRDASEPGHNERLIARALQSWSGDASAVRVATKGGLARPGGRWEPDGRARHLRAACEASLAALGVTASSCISSTRPTRRSRSRPACARWRRSSATGSSSMSASATSRSRSSGRRATSWRSRRCRSSSRRGTTRAFAAASPSTAPSTGSLLAYRPLGGGKAARLARDPPRSRRATRRPPPRSCWRGSPGSRRS